MAGPVRKADRHYTYRELATWPDDERWELIDGVAWNMCAAPSTSHQRVLGDLYEVFRAAAGVSGYEALFAPLDVFLFARSEADTDDADTVVQPDLIVICDDSRVDRRGYLGAPAMTGASPKSPGSWRSPTPRAHGCCRPRLSRFPSGCSHGRATPQAAVSRADIWYDTRGLRPGR